MDDLAKKTAIRSVQAQQMIDASNVSLAVSTFLASIMVFVQRDVVDSFGLMIWFGVLVLVMLARAALVAVYRQQARDDSEIVHVWLMKFRLGVLAGGLVWGSAAWFIFPEHAPQYEMFLIFTLAGLTAGGVISYSADLISGILFLILVLVPIVLRLLFSDNNLSVHMALAGLLYLGFMMASMRHINRNTRENIVLRLDAAAREQAVTASEERYRLLLSHSPVGIFHYDEKLVVSYCNDRFVEILNSSIEQITHLDMMLLNDRAIIPSLQRALAGGIGCYEGAYSATFSDVSIWIAMTSAPSRDSGGNIVGGVAIVQDISERKLADELLHSRSSELELHNDILSQINQHTDLHDLLNEFASRIESMHTSMICAILLLDKDGRTLRTVAAPSLPGAYNRAVDGLGIGEDVGSCGTSAFWGERVIVEDVQAHPFWAPFRDLARSAGVRASWSQPFKSKEGRVLGIFAFYRREPASPTEQELILIDRYANLAQLIVESYRAQDELRIAATAFESQEGMLITDENSITLRVNSAVSHITGYAADEVIGKNSSLLGSDRHDPSFYSAMWTRINNTGAWEGEIWNRHRNGVVYPAYLTITAVKGAGGRVTNYVATFNDISVSKAAADEIKSLAYYDTLTGLPNRRLLMDRLNHALAAGARSDMQGALLFIDLDNFKTLNDTLGHDIGDLLLQQVAKRLETCVREGDTVARLGGDEFVVMLSELSHWTLNAAAQTEVVGEKITALLNQPYQLAIHEYHNSPSIGVTLFQGHRQSTDELMKQADIAMYQAKKAGRNTLRFFDPKMQDAINARAALEGELRHALEKGQFHLYYQIQVDSLNRPLGAEALIRWIHPTRGMVPPDQFIPLSEETGLILPIGLWVLETACAQLQTWQRAEGTHDLVLAVNVSAKQFRQADFVSQVKSSLQTYAIKPSRLKLELTESMLLDNIEDTIATMNDLKKIGVQFSLDDFGTGYSSLQYLKRLPLDQLKIDQSFVRDISTDSSDKAIVHTIIAMAHSLNLDVIAEGVETEQQKNMLLERDCTHFQGYYFGRPMPIEQFDAQLNQG